MTWPASDVNTTNVDSPNDSPAVARSDFLDLKQKFNQIRNHVSSVMQGFLSSASLAAARASLGAAGSGANTDVTSINGNTISAGYLSVTTTTPRYELHALGIAANMFRLLSNGDIVLEQTSGSGVSSGVGEFTRFGRSYFQHRHASLANMQWHVPGFGARSITLGTDNILRVVNTVGDGVPVGASLLTLDVAGNMGVLAGLSVAGLDARPLGMGQTRQNLIGSRSLNTTYNNSTGRSIEIGVGINMAAGSTAVLAAGGIGNGQIGADSGNTTTIGQIVSRIVRNGEDYGINTLGTVTIGFWIELR